MRRRRVSAGGVLAWREALGFLRGHIGALVGASGVILAGSIFINVFPGVPVWEAGFTTGFLVATVFGFAWWLAWVPSGLASRSMGLVAEQWTSELLRKSPGVRAVVPSLKFEGKDVDHVVVAAAGIAAVETKWTARAPSPSDLERAADQAADAGRTLRLSLRRRELSESLFTSAVIYWGPGGHDIAPRVVETGKGPVTVMSGDEATSWLEGLRNGPVGQDYAESLSRELQTLAARRDREAIKSGRMVRWLAKAK